MIKAKKEKIIVYNKNFNIKEILECGQVFSYSKISDNSYRVISCDKVAIVTLYKDRTEIETKFIDYFYNYFDLNTDYEKIKREIIKKDADFEKYIVEDLNILKQDPYQTIISFIVSANNNIKRITKILNNISLKYGTFLKEHNCYSFPSLEQLTYATVEDFKLLGCGYRAKYLTETIKKLNTKEFSIEHLKELESDELKKQLLKLDGVGPKVADCILFFGFSKTNFFPVDTWIRKAYLLKISNKNISDSKISKYYVNKFGNYSGYAQQYLYNYMIKNKIP